MSTRAFKRSGTAFYPTLLGPNTIEPVLPPGVYLVKHHPLMGYYVEQQETFTLPAKLYGRVNQQAQRIVDTFLDRPGTTGVLLSGQKGAGKTMLTKRVSQLAMVSHNVPTLMVNQPFSGDEFNEFLTSIEQPCIVLFDEFEKVYEAESQQKLLTLLDGTFCSKKLFLLTCNKRHRIDENLQNRPGRIYYSMDFVGLDNDFIRDYCEDQLANMAHLRGVLNVSMCFSHFTFDMLKALVEEMNRYGESASDALQMLNIQPSGDDSAYYTIEAVRNGEPLVCQDQSHNTVRRNPMTLKGFNVTFDGYDDDEPAAPSGALRGTETFTLTADNLQAINQEAGIFIFSTHCPDTQIHLYRVRPSTLVTNYDSH